jgi:hypothetical protein
MTIEVVLLVWAASVAAGVLVGRRKNRRGLLYGLLLPVVGVGVLALLPARPPHEDVLGAKWDESYTAQSDSVYGSLDDAFFKNQQYYSKH